MQRFSNSWTNKLIRYSHGWYRNVCLALLLTLWCDYQSMFVKLLIVHTIGHIWWHLEWCIINYKQWWETHYLYLRYNWSMHLSSSKVLEYILVWFANLGYLVCLVEVENRNREESRIKKSALPTNKKRYGDKGTSMSDSSWRFSIVPKSPINTKCKTRNGYARCSHFLENPILVTTFNTKFHSTCS